MGHQTEYVTEGNDRFYQCSCGKQISTGHEADKHLLRSENERLEARVADFEDAIRAFGHYDTCDSALSPDMPCSCPARFLRPVPLVGR